MEKNKPVLFINSALTSDDAKGDIFDFFVLLTANLCVEFHKNNYDVVMKVPENQNSAAKEQNEFIGKIFQDYVFRDTFHNYYSGVVIAPFDKESLLPNLVRYIKQLKNNEFPIVTIDKGFKHSEFSTPGVKIPCVICDGEIGGKIAAECFNDYIKAHPRLFSRRRPQIIILKGLESSKERIKGFLDNIDPRCDIFKTLQGEYKRSTAKQKVKEFITGNVLIDGFFCCNDEMALGVRDSIEEHKEKLENEKSRVKREFSGRDMTERSREIDEKISRLNQMRIVGYDGIKEVRVLLRQPSERWLLNSVDVQISTQVQALKKLYIEIQNRDKKSAEPDIEIKIVPKRVVEKQKN